MLQLNVELRIEWGPFGTLSEGGGDAPLPGPLDLVFVLDATSSMRDAIASVRTGAQTILDAAIAISESNLQLGLVTFRDQQVIVMNDLALDNSVSVRQHLDRLSTQFQGVGNPESWDEALNTVVHRLRASQRPIGFQSGNFIGVWRPGVYHLIVLVTDAPPSGFDIVSSPASVTHARALGAQARGLGIHIASVFVPTGGDYDDQAGLLREVAELSRGVYVETDASGSDLATAIVDVLTALAAESGLRTAVRVRS